METPETIRVSLQKGEWVTSLDFSDAYFHIPIHPRSRKYLRFFLNSKAYQFTALPFGLATAPLEFTKVVKEVKLLAQTRGIRIHQYLDDWLLRAKLLFVKNRDSCTVRQFMSLIGLLTATEKQVWLGRLRMRPIQWHLKQHWHVPEVLEKVIPVPPSLHPHLD